MLLFPVLFLSTQTIRLEAEDAVLDGPRVERLRPGYSGKGYVTGFIKEGARISWKFTAKAGVYEARLGYAASLPKGFAIAVDGFSNQGMLPATGDSFGVQDAGLVELKDGMNEASVERGWGYYDVDYLEFVPAPALARVRPVRATLTDRDATPEAKALYRRLVQGYGRTTLSGQYDQDENEFVATKTDRVPAIYGDDLMEYSPSRARFRKKPFEDPIPLWTANAKKGQILTLSWHWNAPSHLINDPRLRMPDGHIENANWDKGFYTYASTFDVQRALADPRSDDYRLILRDIDAIAIPLKQLQAAHVPILFRPLHEAEGGWFWWGAKGPGPCLALWRLLRERLTEVHHLHNLIWVWNSISPQWDPGSDIYDIVAADQYPDDRRDALTTIWEPLFRRYNGIKPIALAEFPGAPDEARMWRFGVRWLYFVSWSGSVGPKSTDPTILRSTYSSPRVTNLSR